MQCAIICDEGFEEILKSELEKKYDICNITIEKTIILFEPKSASNWIELLARIAYTFQGAIKILSHVITFESQNFELIKKTLKDKLTSEYKQTITTLSDMPIRVSCVRKGTHEYGSTDITSEVAKTHFDQIDFKSLFSYFLYINNEKGYAGVDFTGRELHKRDYKIFLGAQTLRSTVAFNTFLWANVSKEHVIIDPFMGSGTIPIEAGLYFTKTSPFYFSKEKFTFTTVFKHSNWNEFFKKIDEKRDMKKTNILGFDSLLKFLKNSQKNAKIADINKVITLSKVEIDWLDTKIQEQSIDAIITHPPLLSENGSVTKIIKVYKDFFTIAKYMLTQNGTITILTTQKSLEKMKPIAKEQSFIISKEDIVFEGKEQLVIARFIHGQ